MIRWCASKKLKLVLDYLENKLSEDQFQQMGISPEEFFNWVRRWNSGGKRGLMVTRKARQ